MGASLQNGFQVSLSQLLETYMSYDNTIPTDIGYGITKVAEHAIPETRVIRVPADICAWGGSPSSFVCEEFTRAVNRPING